MLLNAPMMISLFRRWVSAFALWRSYRLCVDKAGIIMQQEDHSAIEESDELPGR